MGKCSYCSAIDLACTYNKPNKVNHRCSNMINGTSLILWLFQKRRDPPSNAYVVALESRLKRMERMLVQVRPFAYHRGVC
jgi:hypothetical protein